MSPAPIQQHGAGATPGGRRAARLPRPPWWALPALAVVLAVTLFHGRALMTEATVQSAVTDIDVIESFRPHALDQFGALERDGALSPWNDRVALGAVRLGQYGTYYPPRIVALELAPSAGAAADLLAWSHALLAALAVMALARLYGAGPWPAAAAGVAYALSHLVVRWTPFFWAPPFFALMPAALLGLELVWRRRAGLGAPLMALAVGLAALGAHLQAMHLLVQMLGVVLLFRVALDGTRLRTRLAPLGWSLAGLAGGAVVGAAGWLPFLLEQRRSIRQVSDFATVTGLSARSLVSLVDPVVGNVNADLFIGPIGGVLVLAGLGVAVRSRRAAVLPLLLSLALLVGFKTPLLDALVAVVPGWAAVSNVERVSFVAILPLALLTGLGLQALTGAPRAVRAAGALAIVAATAAWAVRTALYAPEGIAAIGAGVLLVAVAGLLLTAAAIMLVRGRLSGASRAGGIAGAAVLAATGLAALREQELSVTGNRPGLPASWRAAAPGPPSVYRPWLGLVRAHGDPAGRWMSHCQRWPERPFAPVAFLEAPGRWLDDYESFVEIRFFAFWRSLTNSTVEPTSPASRYALHRSADPPPTEALVDAAGITRVLSTPACRPERGRRWQELARAGGFVVYRNADAFPPAYVSHRYEAAPDADTALYHSRRSRRRFPAHIDRIEADSLPPPADLAPEPARVIRTGRERVTVVSVNGAGAPAPLVLLDFFHPEWHAYAGGRRLRMLRVAGAFRAVLVPPGRSVVEFRFEPWWGSLLPTAGGLLALLLVGAGVAGLVRERRNP